MGVIIKNSVDYPLPHIPDSWHYFVIAWTVVLVESTVEWWLYLTVMNNLWFHSPKNFTCLSGKLRREFTSAIAKSSIPGISNTTFFSHWTHTLVISKEYCVFIHGISLPWNVDHTLGRIFHWFYLVNGLK